MFNSEPMSIMDLKIAIDRAIEELGPDAEVYLNYTEFANPLYKAMSVYTEIDEDGLIDGGKPFITISAHTQDSIRHRIANADADNIKKVFFSKN